MGRTAKQQAADFQAANDRSLVVIGSAIQKNPTKPAKGAMYKLADGSWHYLGAAACGLLPDGYPKWDHSPAKPAPQYPTEDAYMRACRALHWRNAQLRAHGIEPDQLANDAPHYPPEGHVFKSQEQG